MNWAQWIMCFSSGLLFGYVIGSYWQRTKLEPWQKCKYCRSDHDKALHDELLERYGR